MYGDNYKKEVKEALKVIRRAIEDAEDWNELYGLDEDLNDLAMQSEFKLVELHGDS
jgi:hypothetical protein